MKGSQFRGELGKWVGAGGDDHVSHSALPGSRYSVRSAAIRRWTSDDFPFPEGPTTVTIPWDSMRARSLATASRRPK